MSVLITDKSAQVYAPLVKMAEESLPKEMWLEKAYLRNLAFKLGTGDHK